MRFEVIPSGDNEVDKVVFNILNKYDLPKIISEKTNLSWYKDKIYIKHNEGNADWENDDTILVDYKRGVWIVSGIAHELVHLILRQNKWQENKIISDFVKDNSGIVVHNKRRGDGYLIEQIIAYLIQKEVDQEIGKEEQIDSMIETFGEKQFEQIIENEFNSELKERLARVIIKEWKIRKSDENLIKWIEGVLLNKF